MRRVVIFGSVFGTVGWLLLAGAAIYSVRHRAVAAEHMAASTFDAPLFVQGCVAQRIGTKPQCQCMARALAVAEQPRTDVELDQILDRIAGVCGVDFSRPAPLEDGSVSL